jgi:hypothetical protein
LERCRSSWESRLDTEPYRPEPSSPSRDSAVDRATPLPERARRPPSSPAPSGPASHPLLGYFAWLVTVLALASLLLGSLVLERFPAIGAVARTPATWDRATVALLDRAVGGLAEEPHFAQVGGSGPLPLCQGVEAGHVEAFREAFRLMRYTPEGERLFQQLLDERICVRAGEIDYNSGYAYVVQSITGSWSRSYIMVATRHVATREPDVLAAILVHEATHVDRYVSGTACSYRDDCTVLPNGVELEEEIVAHAAEAAWWVAQYGDDGKRFAFGYDYGMNELVEAYLDGDDAFRAYVLKIRSDDREGAGV